MGWTVVRKDFTGQVSVDCAFSEDRGHKKLTSGIAYVVINEAGEEAFAGKTCVRRVDNPSDINTVPDFTRACSILNKRSDGEASGERKPKESSLTSPQSSTELEVQIAISYLLLRCKILSYYNKLKVYDRRINEIYALYLAKPKEPLPLNDVKYLNACAKNTGHFAKLSLNNLMCFHNCRVLIKMLEGLKNLSRPDKKWLDAVGSQLFKESYLDDETVEQLNLRLNAYGFNRLRVKTGYFYISKIKT